MTGRGWCFTINNPTEDDEQRLEALRKACGSSVDRGEGERPSDVYGVDSLRPRYCVYQLERGTAGTLHYQGFLYSADKLGRRRIAKVFPRAHLEVAKGTPEQVRDYCTKDDTRVAPPCEAGTLPQQGKRNDLVAAAALAKEGRYKEIDPATFVRYHKGLMNYQQLFLEPRNPKDDPPKVYWFWGPTGAGKSRAAWEEHCDGRSNYWVSQGKWWCGYLQQDVVVLDDYRPELMSFRDLLRLLDRYPYQVEWKGGKCWINSKVFIITAPHPPEFMFQDKTDEAIGQLTRRIEEVREFTKD